MTDPDDSPGETGEPGESGESAAPVHRGLAVERTTLAWSRSGLAVVGCLAALARRFVPINTRGDRIGAFALLSLAGLSWAAALALGRRRAGALDPHTGPQHRHLLLIAVSTTTIGAGAFLIGLFSPR